VNSPPSGFVPTVNGKEDQGDEEEDGTHCGPHLRRQWRHKREESRLLLHGLLDHDAYAELHERGAKIHDPFSRRCDRHTPQSDIRFLFFYYALLHNFLAQQYQHEPPRHSSLSRF